MTLLNILSKEPASNEVADKKPAKTQTRYFRPRYQILDTENAYSIEVDVPGVAKSGLEITLEDGVLEVVGNRSWKAPEDWKSIDNSYSEVAYRLRLAIGDSVNDGGIEAEVEDGVLRITLPKVEDKKPRKISVK